MTDSHEGLTRVAVAGVEAKAYVLPTDGPEADGTFDWCATTLVVVTVRAGGQTGLGYTYADRSVAALINQTLASPVIGTSVLAPVEAWRKMGAAVCYHARPGLAAQAISAVDVALWDLKARLLDVSLLALLGPVRPEVSLYGSGGFTSYDDQRLTAQLEGWVAAGFRRVKIKVGREPDRDPHRVRKARAAVGAEVALMVDADGAYPRKLALALAERFAEHDVCRFEEPVPAEDLAGLRLVAERGPAGMEIAAGAAETDAGAFRRLLEAGAVDTLQADATRCGGVTGFLHVAALAEAWGLPLTAHAAPGLHATLGCACPRVREIEYYHDHARIESKLFDGAVTVRSGLAAPDPARPGLGLTLRTADAEPFAVT